MLQAWIATILELFLLFVYRRNFYVNTVRDEPRSRHDHCPLVLWLVEEKVHRLAVGFFFAVREADRKLWPLGLLEWFRCRRQLCQA